MAKKMKAVKKKATKSAGPVSLSKDDYPAPYRGSLRGLDSVGSTLVFSTEHDEGQPTGIFRYDLEKKSLETTALDCGVTAQALGDGGVWTAGTDNLLRYGKLGNKPAGHRPAPRAVGEAFDARVVAMAAFDGGVAVVAGDSLHLVTAKGKRTSFELGEPGRSVAVDPTGRWIAAGTTRGHMCVFSDSDGAFAEVSRTRLHDGEVTALAFAPDELRVYSTGTDCRLLFSFVRGSLDTEDRGGSNMHEKQARAILIGPDFETEDGTNSRFFTAGFDRSIKSWPRGRGGSQRPATQEDGVKKTFFLSLVEFDGKPHLAAAGSTSITVFAFDAEGRVGERVACVRDAYTLAGASLGSQKPKEREAALKELASFADASSLDQMSNHLSSVEADHKLKVRGVELIATVDHAHTAAHLEGFFQHEASDVRVAAFDGLRKVRGTEDVDLLTLAAGSGYEDLGLRSVEAALKLGTPGAVDMIRENLDHANGPVRLAALTALEAHYGDGPEGTLAGLKSTQADIRRTAIVRLQKRGVLDASVVTARLRRLWDDDDDRARLWAFVVAAHRRPNLVKALRAVDDDFHRQVFELEEFGKDEKKRRKDVPAAKAFDAKKLNEEDFRPLLEAMGSRSIDVCLRGARGLAALGDERAFGTLLQLSRESDSASRVTVCKALQVLGDPRSIKRVRAMLHDDNDNVRAAAFSALSDLQADRPLDTVRSGLSVSALDVRERALALLVKVAKKPKAADADELRALLPVVLNDGAASLRQEAFKSVLNLAPDGGGAATLRFIMQSVHADVRNEVLQEAKAHPKEQTYRAVILELIDDPEDSNRTEAFTHALDRWPSKENAAIFRAALGSSHVSQRVAAVRKLSEQKGEIRALLVEALKDNDSVVRLEAVRALVQAENRALLADALRSEHLDVRVEAAVALATLGDERALAPLLEVVAGYHELVVEKANADDIAAYAQSLQVALTGMSQLGHPDAIDAVLSLLSGDVSIANGAAAVLPSVAHPSNLAKVRGVANHESQTVRELAALALAYNGDASSARVVFGATEPYFQLFAALGLREHGPERFLSFVDSDDEKIRNVALALTLALELSEHTDDGIPERCLSLLSAKSSFIRLSAAEALEHYSDQPAFYQWVYAMLNGIKSPADAWQAEPRKLLALSRVLAFGQPRLAVRAAQILAQLTESKADEFERQWRLFEDRFGDVLADLEKQANKTKAAPVAERVARAWRRLKAKTKSIVVASTTFDEALRSLAFGAYVGLARQQGDGGHHLRGAAISGLMRLAPTSDRFRADAISVMLLALGDPNQTVRERAFDVLRELGTSDEVLSTEALSTGLSDMGFRGLELLASGAKGGNALLEKTLLESTNGLEEEAAKLLADRVGWVEVHRIGLGAASESFRGSSVRGLSKEYGRSEAADALRGALGSRHEDVRFLAARELANKRDGASFDVLLEMLGSSEGSPQRQAVQSLQQLRDERAPSAWLDRVEDDADDSAEVSSLLDAAAAFGDPAIAPRLIALIDADKHRSDAFGAALKLSGYTQFEWMEDEDVTTAWEESLTPLHSGVFAELFDLAYRIADHEMLGSLAGLAKWPAESAAIDATLAALLGFSDENIRHRAVEITGWRLRHRGGPADGLKAALTGRDPLDQIYAAEGLALAGHADGLAVLRTAVDAIDDSDLRERAVLAIGQLADPSTVDMLLAIADDDSHSLQSAAAQAIGHMSQSERADEVFATLKRLASGGSYDGNTEAAFKGLRWFGTPGAWDVLRRGAKSDEWWIAQKCVDMLRFDQDSKEIVAEVLRENDDWDVAESCAEGLRHLWGPESLEPDYIMLQASISGLDEQDKALERLRERGDASRILDVLAKVHEDNEDEFVQPLVAILLSRSPLPVAEAASMLASDQSRTASVAAQIVGRAGSGAAKDHGKALSAATKGARETWLSLWEGFLANKRGAQEKLTDVGVRYRRLVWATGQLEVGKDEILAAASLPDHALALPIREDAIATLGEPWFGKEGIATLVGLASGGDARLRSIAAAELDRSAPAESAKLLASSVHDDVSFGRLLNSLDAKAAQQPLREAVGEAAGIALPRLAALGDIAGLTAAMRNQDLAETTRRGAIDALAMIAADGVAEKLAEFGADEDQDEMLRKAAWRARRRVTRAAVARKEAP